jgi:hypothetical protein
VLLNLNFGTFASQKISHHNLIGFILYNFEVHHLCCLLFAHNAVANNSPTLQFIHPFCKVKFWYIGDEYLLSFMNLRSCVDNDSWADVESLTVKLALMINQRCFLVQGQQVALPAKSHLIIENILQLVIFKTVHINYLFNVSNTNQLILFFMNTIFQGKWG